MTDLRDKIGYLLWQIEQGYIAAEDRAVGSNWFDRPTSSLHPDDVVTREQFREAADTLIEALRDEGLLVERPPIPPGWVVVEEEGGWWYVVDPKGERYAGPYRTEDRAWSHVPRARA